MPISIAWAECNRRISTYDAGTLQYNYFTLQKIQPRVYNMDACLNVAAIYPDDGKITLPNKEVTLATRWVSNNELGGVLQWSKTTESFYAINMKIQIRHLW